MTSENLYNHIKRLNIKMHHYTNVILLFSVIFTIVNILHYVCNGKNNCFVHNLHVILYV